MRRADAAEVARDAMLFREQLERTKATLEDASFWYPYDIMANFLHLDHLLTGEYRSVFDRLDESVVADIGAADGDLAFFCESRGAAVDIIDHGSTNFNGLRGARRMQQHLGSSVSIHDIDLDNQFTLPRERYDLTFFLGILYHLKNPFFVMEHLARRSETCFLSTRVAKYAGPQRTSIQALPVAYLLGPREANNDPTNFWIFSTAGLRRLLDRCGWDVLAYATVGNVENSDPATAQGDERAFCYLRSRHDFGSAGR